MKVQGRGLLGPAAAACLLLAVSLSGCGSGADAASCRGAAAWVGTTAIARSQYHQLLSYTLGFYENTNPRSRYYHRKLCSATNPSSQCVTIERALVQRMIDQEIVAEYAAAHNLLPTSGDWVRALRQEGQVVRAAGGQTGFLTYLSKVGISQAEFRWVESQEIETAKVGQAVGSSHFRSWLAGQEAKVRIVRCVP